MPYDSVIITAILVFDMLGGTASVVCAWLTWLMLTDRRKARIKRFVSRTLRTLFTGSPR